MFLIARNIDNSDYLTVYNDKTMANQRLSVFKNDGDNAFMIEVDKFDYCTAEGLMADCPDFSHLLIDYKKNTIAWDTESIAKELESEKVLAINYVVELAYAERIKQEKESLYAELTGISAFSVHEDIISKYKSIINAIDAAMSKSELNCINKELLV